MSNFTCSFLSICLLISVCVTAPAATYAQFCQPGATLTVTNQDKTSISPPRVDWMSFFEDANKQSLMLTVQGSDTTADYMFSSYSKTGQIDQDRACTGTNGYFFQNLLNGYLFVSNGTHYFVCLYAPGKNSVPVLMRSTAVVAGSIVRFMPYLVSGSILYVLVTDPSNSVVAKYTYSATGPLQPVLEANTIGTSLVSAIGTESFLFDAANGKYWRNTASAWVTGNLSTTTIYEPATETIKGYALRDANFIMVSTYLNKTDRMRAYKGSVVLAETLVPVVSTTDIIYTSDSLNNFIRVGSTVLYWYTLTPAGTFIISNLTIVDDPNLALIQSVGISQNKAVVYHSNGQVDYYKHVSASLIRKYFSRTISNLPTASYAQSHISLNCMCQAIKSTSCWSQTLSCTILNRAAGDCKGPGDSYTIW